MKILSLIDISQILSTFFILFCLLDVEFTLPALMDLTGSCHDLAVCIIDQESEGCKAVGGADAERTSARVIVGNDGVYECDDSNEAAGLNNEQVCNLISPNACLESSVLPGCFYRYITGSKLSSDMNSNCDEEVEEEDEEVDEYAYLTFNSDDKCTELAVAKPIKSGKYHIYIYILWIVILCRNIIPLLSHFS